MSSLPETNAIETVIVPRSRDLGGFEVRRALPAPRRQMVGPFIFFDEMGPAEFLTGQGIDVRPHPHVGLSTVTYLFRGRMHHRDSLGTDSWIEAGAVNLMRAGRGITHSERTDGEMRRSPFGLHGIQTWMALPEHLEDAPPDFSHAAAGALPVLEDGGLSLRLVLGEAWGLRAPMAGGSRCFYADARLRPGAGLPLPDDHEDRGVYVLEGSVEIAGEVFESGRMLVFRPRDSVSMRAGPRGARVMLLGGDTLNGPRYIWWNFVASSRERIEAARLAWQEGDWQNGRFRLPPSDNSEFIPLP
jgi:redox-sensitive bicupin YhaK (pirin superfamily)